MRFGGLVRYLSRSLSCGEFRVFKNTVCSKLWAKGEGLRGFVISCFVPCVVGFFVVMA